jgi:hypothetical protein
VAGCAYLLDLDKQNILIAINRDRFDVLKVAAGLAFEPELIAAAAEEMRFAALDRFFKRLAVHPRHHENLPGGRILNDGGDQAAGIEFEAGKQGLHGDICRDG